jgi:ABC-type hemin transport system, periplasmic component
VRRAWSFVVALACAGIAQAAPERIVSLGGDLTEIVYQLGKGDALVGVDLTSTYPEEATKLPQVGYVRALSAEGILAMKPDLVLANGDAGPPEVLEQIEQAGVKIVTLPKNHSVEGIGDKIVAVAGALEVPEAGAKLAEEFNKERAAVEATTKTAEPLTAVYVMARPDGALIAGGAGTAADAVLRAAGLKNVAGDAPGYKPVSSEALVALDPAVIITGSRSVEAAGGIERFKENPALSHTKAAKDDRILVFDDMYLLGLGPRTAKAVGELAARARN